MGKQSIGIFGIGIVLALAGLFLLVSSWVSGYLGMPTDLPVYSPALIIGLLGAGILVVIAGIIMNRE